MIDITKPVKTRNGKRVLGLARVTHNSAGALVTYPLKGSVVLREKPLKLDYRIWSDDGKYDVVWGNHPEKDLINC